MSDRCIYTPLHCSIWMVCLVQFHVISYGSLQALHKNIYLNASSLLLVWHVNEHIYFICYECEFKCSESMTRVIRVQQVTLQKMWKTLSSDAYSEEQIALDLTVSVQQYMNKLKHNKGVERALKSVCWRAEELICVPLCCDVNNTRAAPLVLWCSFQMAVQSSSSSSSVLGLITNVYINAFNEHF